MELCINTKRALIHYFSALLIQQVCFQLLSVNVSAVFHDGERFAAPHLQQTVSVDTFPRQTVFSRDLNLNQTFSFT